MTKIKYVQIAVFALVAIISIVFSIHISSFSNPDRPTASNDERNWTSVSISSYEMFFKSHQRPNVKMDSWFTTYAIENGIDTNDIDPKQKQWYDFAMWTFGWKAPNMGKYIMGANVSAFANQELDKNGYYELGRSELAEDPKIFYSRASDDLVYLARIPNAIMNGLSITLIFLTGWIFLNWVTGLVASLYLMANNVFMMVNTAAGLDSPSIFFWILAVFFLAACIRTIFRDEKLWKTLLFALATGISFAFAVSSKLNDAQFGFLCLFVFPLAAIILYIGRKPEKNTPFLKTTFGKRLSALFLSGAIIAVVGLPLFWVLNPQMQGNGVNETITRVKVVRQSADEFFMRRANSQTSKNRQARKVLTEVTYKKPAKAFNLVVRRNLLVDDTQNYHGTFGNILKFKGNFLDGLFVIIGFVALLWAGFVKFRKEKKLNGEWIILLSFLVMFYGMVHFIWIDFARYHMAIYPGMALLVGYGIYTLSNFITSKFSKKTSSKS